MFLAIRHLYQFPLTLVSPLCCVTDLTQSYLEKLTRFACFEFHTLEPTQKRDNDALLHAARVHALLCMVYHMCHYDALYALL